MWIYPGEKMSEWIKCAKSLPRHTDYVEVIFMIRDVNECEPFKFVNRRLIGIGRFESYKGWHIKNGFIKENFLRPSEKEEYIKFEYVTYWREFDEETKKLVSKTSYDVEEFHD